LQQVNRAIKARASIYAEDWTGALDALDDSFMDLTSGEASMNVGVYHVYGNPPDAFNPLFYPLDANTNQIMVVHPSMIDDAEAGDQRVANKFYQRTDPVSNANIPEDAEYQDARWASNTSSIPYLRNEELILIYAEAQTNLEGATATNYTNAAEAINYVRNTWNLADYGGTLDEASLIDEILLQRRYSLWAEFGHRWIDMRRYDRLDEIDQNDKLVGTIFEQMAQPQSEINFENF